jgi:hypothetical protein
MTKAGFEPAFPASERPQIYALERAATGFDKGGVSQFSILIDFFMIPFWAERFQRKTKFVCDLQLLCF